MVEINNLTERKINLGLLEKTAREILEKEGKTGFHAEDFLSIAFVGPKKMAELNGRYRKKKGSTDVLAFGEPEGSQRIGEVVICPAAVSKNAVIYGQSFQKELTKVLIHGILHLLGYDHEKSRREEGLMQAKELYYISKIKHCR